MILSQCFDYSLMLYIYDESSRVNNGMFKTREASCDDFATQKSNLSQSSDISLCHLHETLFEHAKSQK